MRSSDPRDPGQHLRDILDGFALSGAHKMILDPGAVPQVRTGENTRPLRGSKKLGLNVVTELLHRIGESTLISAPSGWFSVEKAEGPDRTSWIVTAFKPLHQVSQA